MTVQLKHCKLNSICHDCGCDCDYFLTCIPVFFCQLYTFIATMHNYGSKAYLSLKPFKNLLL